MKLTSLLVASVLGLGTAFGPAAPLGTAFTYQGRLADGANLANGTHYMLFELYDAPSGGVRVATQPTNTVAVSNGLFSVDLDFGATAFLGDARWLEISVRTNGGLSVVLSPRTRVAPAPGALYASTAGTVKDGAIQVSQLGTIGSPPFSGQVLSYDGSALVWQYPVAAGGAWAVGGNNASAGNFLGTLNSLPLELKANNERVLRLEPNGTSPNLIAGWSGNGVSPGAIGGTIGGGGVETFFGRSGPNRVTDDFGTVSGGANNVAGLDNGEVQDGWFATVGGGQFNRAEGIASTIGGGSENRTSNNDTTVSGGYQNQAIHLRATVGGGQLNVASGEYATVSGGRGNTASGHYASIGGGSGNRAVGYYAAVPGGAGNQANADFSFAAGLSARANHPGCFVWADSYLGPSPHPAEVPFPSTRNDEFAVRANGGVRFQAPYLTVSGSGSEGGYIGGDGVGGEVHVGSLNPVTAVVALYNQTSGQYMHLNMKSCTIFGGADIAEPFQMSETNIAKGAVVVIDPAHPGRLRMSEAAYDKRVAGIVSGANGVNPGIALQQQGVLEGGQNVALSGRVYVQADAAHGAIEPGDLLTTSDTPGHAMKVLDPARAQGAILGKAMSPLSDGKGMVLVLVTLQ